MIPQLRLLPDGRYYEELHARLTAARRRVYVSMFLFSRRRCQTGRRWQIPR